MAEKVLMLALSPTMTEGTIAAWKYKEGDEVKKSSVLCEVETDKAVMDYESASSGVLLKIVKAAGEKAAVGDLIAVVGKAGEDPGIVVSAAPAPAAVPAQVPAAPVSAPPPVSAAAPAAVPVSAPASAAYASGPALAPALPRSSPLARVLARDAGIDLRSVSGSGPAGRVVKRDVESYLAAGGGAEAASAAAPNVVARSADARATSAVFAPPAPRAVLEDRLVPVSRMRAAVAKRLSESMREAPHFFLRAAVEADRLLSLRALANEGRTDKLSLNSFFVKLSAAAIERHPAINSSWEGTNIRFRRSVDIALAVALPDGLIAPVVRDCANKGVEEIESDLRALISKAKAGGLRPEDYEGASFTISNLGAWGVEEFTAIINPPGSAILALGAVSKEAVVRQREGVDEVVVRQMLRATLSCDHRTIDGAVGAAFLKDLKAIFEEPARALF